MNAMSNSSESLVKTCVLLKESRDVFVDFPSNGYKICYAVMFAVNIILIIPTVLLNGTSVIAILKCSQLNTKVYFFLVLVQSIIDLTVGLLGLPLFIVILATELFGSVNCVVSVVAQKIMVLPSSFAIMTLIALTFERYTGSYPSIFIRGENNERKNAHVYPVIGHLNYNLVGRFV